MLKNDFIMENTKTSLLYTQLNLTRSEQLV